jgi:ATP-binding cassette subfamily B protein
LSKREFTAPNAYPYVHTTVVRWLLSHLNRHRLMVAATLFFGLLATYTFTYSPVLIGQAAEEVMNPTGQLASLALLILGVLVISGLADLGHALTIETLAQRLETGVREELYGSLLGKSQTFHDRQRVGDIMALATDDAQQLNGMLNPGVYFIFTTILGIAIPMFHILRLRPELLLVPIVFVIAYVVVLRRYMRQLEPVTFKQRHQFGKMNAVAEESISGIEIVKASAQEAFEQRKFSRNARLFRGYFVRQGYIEARYLPMLLFGITVGLALLHSIILYNQGTIGIAEIVAYMGLINVLRFPTFISVFSFSLVQLGLASAGRILKIIRTETELDENVGGHSAPLRGEIEFDHVTFGFDGQTVLEDISFHIRPGQTVAIVGQTGSGKSTLTQLINRTYDVDSGRILIDGVDVRDWDLSALRSQISNIEQDIFLFSRSLSENIAFGKPEATQADIELAAKEAQAHEFITSFNEGYATKVGERGVTLSGGQRQRIALARAFLSDPRVLILDDSTSAIDSATEDSIQKAIRRAQQGRTTLLITHRLSQIRWADHILVLDRGRMVASGSHDELLRRSPHYRRIFARYDLNLPPLEAAVPA